MKKKNFSVRLPNHNGKKLKIAYEYLMVSFPFHFTYKEEKKFTTKNLAQSCKEYIFGQIYL